MTVFQEAADPNTPASRLAELASSNPEVRPIIALHPAAYDGLLDWLDEHGDANTKAAVAQRRSTPAGPPAPPAAAAPVVGGYAAAVNAAPGSAPQAAAPLAPRPKGPGFAITPRILAIGIGALLVLTLIIVAVIVVPRFVGGGGSGGDVQAASYNSEPEQAWALNGPEGFEGDFYGASLETVGRDRAIVTWQSDDSDDVRLSLVDTRSGTVLWDRKAGDLANATVVAADSTAAVFAGYGSDDEFLISVRLSDGETLDELENVSQISPNSILGSGLKDRLYVRDEEEVSAYTPSDISTPQWTVDGDEDDQVVIAGSRLIYGTDVYSTDNGSALDWEADDDAYYYGYGEYLITTEDDGESLNIVDPDSGDERWSFDYGEDGRFTLARDVVVFADGGSITGLDPATGEELWEIDGSFDEDGYGESIDDAGVLLLPTDGSEPEAYDARSGEHLYDLDFDFSEDQIIESNQDTIYVAGNKLRAIDARTGNKRWSMSSFESYSFAGGNLVANGDPDDDELLVGFR